MLNILFEEFNYRLIIENLVKIKKINYYFIPLNYYRLINLQKNIMATFFK